MDNLQFHQSHRAIQKQTLGVSKEPNMIQTKRINRLTQNIVKEEDIIVQM